MGKNKCKHYDIICIGAGAAGLYLGYKMTREKSSKSLLILDKNDRIGGKIVSVDFNDNVPYVAEGCAQRFMNGHVYVEELVKFFNLGYSSFRNDLIMTNIESGTEILDSMLEQYPINSKEISKISILDAVINQPSIQDGSYENYKKFMNAIGYQMFISDMNLDVGYNVLFETESVIQNFIDGGFTALFEAMKGYMKYPIKLNTQVYKANYDGYNDRYIINNKYTCKKLVYTGDQVDLAMLNTNSKRIYNIKDTILRNTSVSSDFIRLFVQFNDPWWTKEQFQYKFLDMGPIGTIYYYTEDTLLVYCDMHNAHIIHAMIPFELQKYGHNTIRWLNMNQAPKLKSFLKKYIKPLIQKGADDSPEEGLSVPTDDQLDSSVKFAFKFTKQILSMWKQMSEQGYNDLLSSINNSHNVHFVGGNYAEIQGWVNGAFQCIDQNYEHVVE